MTIIVYFKSNDSLTFALKINYALYFILLGMRIPDWIKMYLVSERLAYLDIIETQLRVLLKLLDTIVL